MMYNSYQDLAQFVPDHSLPVSKRLTFQIDDLDGYSVIGNYTEYQVYGKVVFTAQYIESDNLFYEIEIKDRSEIYSYGLDGEEFLLTEEMVYDFQLANMIEYAQEGMDIEEVA